MRKMIALAAVAAMFVAATPQPGDDDFEPTLRTEAAFFHCSDTEKAGSVDNVNGAFSQWDTTAPDASFQEGAGCGQFDNILSGDPAVASAIFEGTFEGNLDSMTIDLHRLFAGFGGSVTAPQLVLTVEVDGAVLYDDDVTGITWTASSTGASENGMLSFTNLGYMTEHGDGTQSRSIKIRVDSYNDANTVWVYDASEIPAGITFNADKPAFPRIAL